MTRHRPDRRKGSRWPLWLMLAISSVAFIASVHFYTAQANQRAAAGRAAAIAKLDRVKLANARYYLSITNKHAKAAQTQLSRLQDVALEEAGGTSGPGLSGIAGIGPNATRDRAEVNQYASVVKSVLHQLAQAESTVVSLTTTVRQDDSLSHSERTGTSGAWTAVALLGTSLLMTGAAARRSRRLALGQGGSLMRESWDWRPELGRHEWARLAAAKLLSSAISRLRDPEVRARYGEEWAGDMAQISGRWRILWWSATVRISAWRIETPDRELPPKSD